MEMKVACRSCGAEVSAAANAAYCAACGAALGADSRVGSAHQIGELNRQARHNSVPANVAAEVPARRGPNVALRIWMSILLLGLAVYGGLTAWRLYDASRRPYANQPVHIEETGFHVADFELTERFGRTFNSRELAGQMWVASFFFSTCPGECVMLNQAIANQLAGDLAKEPSPTRPVKFVSITVDPQKDTPEELRDYAERYMQAKDIDPRRWLFLTDARGSKEVISAVSQESFKVPFATLRHSSKLILVDQQGMVHGYYSSATSSDLQRLKLDIRKLHKNPPASPERKDSA